MFLTSVRLPNSELPLGRMLMLASQRKLPSCMFPVLTPRYCKMEWRVVRYTCASSAEEMSGALTTSIKGTPGAVHVNQAVGLAIR